MSGYTCTACWKVFSTESTFTKHRVGKFGMTPTERRCLTDEEMSDGGWRLTARGWTNSKPMPEGIHKASTV